MNAKLLRFLVLAALIFSNLITACHGKNPPIQPDGLSRPPESETLQDGAEIWLSKGEYYCGNNELYVQRTDDSSRDCYAGTGPRMNIFMPDGSRFTAFQDDLPLQNFPVIGTLKWIPNSSIEKFKGYWELNVSKVASNTCTYKNAFEMYVGNYTIFSSVITDTVNSFDYDERQWRTRFWFNPENLQEKIDLWIADNTAWYKAANANIQAVFAGSALTFYFNQPEWQIPQENSFSATCTDGLMSSVTGVGIQADSSYDINGENYNGDFYITLSERNNSMTVSIPQRYMAMVADPNSTVDIRFYDFSHTGEVTTTNRNAASRIGEFSFTDMKSRAELSKILARSAQISAIFHNLDHPTLGVLGYLPNGTAVVMVVDVTGEENFQTIKTWVLDGELNPKYESDVLGFQDLQSGTLYLIP